MISDASALKPDFACEPSQFGLFSDAPHLHNAHNLCPSVSTINGPEANTFSGQFLHTENITKVTRSVDQTEDIKIILDF